MKALMRVRRPSLELSWLPLSDRKSIPTPEVAYAEMHDCGGCYVPAGYRDDDFETTGRRDLIVLSTAFGEPRPTTIAHEFRHLMQRYLPSLPRLRFMPALDFGETHETWTRAIRVFYRERPFELDALRYQTRIAPDDLTADFWQALEGGQ